MLGKLIKHEFKATAKFFGAMYLIVLIIGGVLKIVAEIEEFFNVDNMILNMILGVTGIAFVLGIIGVIIGSFILILKRFYDSMIKDEGYLSFTLPVTIGQHIAAKTIVSYLWMLVSAVYVVFMILFMFVGQGEALASLRESLELAIKEINEQHLWSYVFYIIAALALSIYSYIITGYACFSIGQTWNKNKVLGAFVSYIVLYMVNQIISAIFMGIIFGANILGTNMESMEVADTLFKSVMIFSIVYTILQSVVYTIITHVMLNKKLNLQ